MEPSLKSFAEIVKQANEEKKLREAKELTEKMERVTPLLSELFSTISKSKELSVIKKESEAPLLDELRDALENPTEFKNNKKEKTDKILALVTELETKASEIQTKIDEPRETTTDLEKKFLKLFNRLQTDFQTLKKYVDSKQSAISGFTAGSGEVRILRMDDVVKNQVPENGSVMTWDSTLNKFKCIVPQVGTGTDEEMPYAKRIDFVTDDIFYKGEAPVGSSVTAPVWRIKKLSIGVDSDVEEIWASGDSLFDKVWSDRLSYSYI